MLVNRDNLSAIFKNLLTTFNKAFADAPAEWQATAMLIKSTTKTNDYSWISRFPKMKKWIGEKTVKSLSAFKYSITNDDFEATVAVDRNDIEDDNIGLYGPMAQEAGHSSKQWPDEMVSALKDGAFTSLCFDGQYFYDTDHPVEDGDGNVGSVSNKLTAVLSNASLAAATASFGAARLAIQGFKDDEGRPLNLKPDTLEVPPGLETVANMLMNNDKLADNTPNPFKGMAKVIVNGRLTSATAWFLHVTSRPVKPFVFQQRKAPVFVSQTSMENDDVFNRREFKYGAEARGNAGYGLWQLSCGSTGA